MKADCEIFSMSSIEAEWQRSVSVNVLELKYELIINGYDPSRSFTNTLLCCAVDLQKEEIHTKRYEHMTYLNLTVPSVRPSQIYIVKETSIDTEHQKSQSKVVTPRIPDECIEGIVKKLGKDIKSLHSCALLNRQWCKVTVPILWRISSRKHNGRYETIRHWPKMSETILSCLSDQALLLLKAFNFELFPKDRPQPLFNYAEFLTCISESDIKKIARYAIFEMVQRNRCERTLMAESHVLEQELWVLFLACKSNLVYFEYSRDRLICHGEAEYRFSALKILDTDDTISSWAFQCLAKYAQNLQRLRIKLVKSGNEGLMTLIKSQHGLKEFVIKTSQASYPGLEEALRTQVHSLTSIEFEKNVCISSIGEFVDLRKLRIHALLDADILPSKFPDLQVLEISKQNVPFEFCMNIIKRRPLALRKLQWPRLNKANGFDFKLYKRMITIFLSDVRFLSFPLTASSLLHLGVILKTCKQLEGIDIQICENVDYFVLFECLTGMTPENISLVLLSKAGPKSFNISLEHITFFFTEWIKRRKSPFRFYVESELPYAAVWEIKQYVEIGIVKEFRDDLAEHDKFESIRLEWNFDEEERDLLLED
ncbi:14271_t:CDS:2 [Acaulospora morrowiae]|uniref:14271_t:CDS:1 n=1 Tax=Acaulospora morrowiae TaxID=94023 RepID=A0A9N9G1S2_9GLOM|nr:14271_t:CDS:2 [Acaulospora morrowiae]